MTLRLPKRLIFCTLAYCCFHSAPAWAWEVAKSQPLFGDSAIRFIRKEIKQDEHIVEMHLLVFKSPEYTLAVVDDESSTLDLPSAVKARGGVAGVNGGYFHPDHSPLGLVIKDGILVHDFEQAKLLSGVIAVTPRAVSLLRAQQYRPSMKLRQALQAGPFLVDQGKVTTGLNATRNAARTVILSDGGSQCGLLLCRSVTLAEMAEILVAPGVINEIRIQRALNLDGGSSSGMWVRDAAFSSTPWKPVRNYLTVIKGR